MTMLWMREVEQYTIELDKKIVRWDILLQDYNCNQIQYCVHIEETDHQWKNALVRHFHRQFAARILHRKAQEFGSHAQLTRRMYMPVNCAPCRLIEVPI